MSYLDILSHLNCYEKIPIPLNDIRDAIIERGYVDEINFCPKVMDDSKVRGILQHYSIPTAVYAEPDFIADIHYSNSLNTCWERFVCCKEMVHLLDPKDTYTANPEAIAELTFGLTSPKGTSLSESAKKMLEAEGTAEFKALGFLVPEHILEMFKAEYEKKNLSAHKMAQLLRIPEYYVKLMLLPSYSTIAEYIKSSSQVVAKVQTLKSAREHQ